MASPPPSPSPVSEPPWAVLRRMAFTEPDLPQGTGCCLAIGTRPPPGVTDLLVSPLVRDPIVVAADSSGILLLSGSPAGDPEKTSYFLCDSVSGTVRQLPDLPACGNAGLIVGSDHNDFVVAELVLPPDSDTATLHCISPAATIRKTLGAPLLRMTWRTDRVFSYMGKIWWADLSQGLLACDPLAAEPKLHFVSFPNLRHPRMLWQQRRHTDPSSQRRVDVSDGKLRYVVLTTRCRVPRIRFWTLADWDRGTWTQDYEATCQEIWDDKYFNRTGLPNHVPILSLVHPTYPQVVYFVLGDQLFSFDLRMKKVTGTVYNDIGLDDASSTFVLAWMLPPSLKISSGSPFRDCSPSAFDRIAACFSDACDNAILEMEFHHFVKNALADLNKDVTGDMKKFKESERLYLSYFDGEADDVEYAHLNFNAESASRNVTVFAEFSRKVDDMTSSFDKNGQSSWTLSMCKILTKDSHGGLYDEGDLGTRKRKRDLYCFECEAKMQHPKGGFKGGHKPAACD